LHTPFEQDPWLEHGFPDGPFGQFDEGVPGLQVPEEIPVPAGHVVVDGGFGVQPGEQFGQSLLSQLIFLLWKILIKKILKFFLRNLIFEEN